MLGKTKFEPFTQPILMEPPVLTTMVVLYTMGVRLDTDILVNNMPLNNGIIKIEKQGVLRRGQSKRDQIRHRTTTAPAVRRTTGFGHNSITLVLLSKGTSETLPEKEITVKIFQNGVFHITGVRDEEYDRDVTKRLHDHIQATCPTAVLSGEWDLNSRRVVLMNYKTRLIGIDNLSRESLCATIKQRGYKTNYEPAVYPAVKIYFPDTRWIAKVFRTGNIILTGMTTSTECESLMNKLREVLV
jgi:TATA-box binding protein (TBP) (component of TFIID and TFIIIB)